MLAPDTKSRECHPERTREGSSLHRSQPNPSRNTAQDDEGADTIYYDASCGICSAGVRRTQRLLAKRGFVFEPLQGKGVAEMLELRTGEIPDEMKLRTREGATLGGADAAVYIARRIWWAWPIWLISRIPGAMPMMRRGYRFIARRRNRISRSCALPDNDDASFSRRISVNTELSDNNACPCKIGRYIPPFVIVAASSLVGTRLSAPWMFLWLLAVAIFAACKWITWWP